MTISESAKEAAEKCWDISHREDFRKTASEIIQTAIDNSRAHCAGGASQNQSGDTMTISQSAKDVGKKLFLISDEFSPSLAAVQIQIAIDFETATLRARIAELEQNAREIKRMREALEMVVKICESTKRVDRIGDIRRESNSAIYGLKIGDKVRITKGIYKQPSGDSPGEIHATRGQEATVKEIAKHFFFALVETDHTFFVKADEIEALSPNQPSEQEPTQPNTATGSPARPQSDSVPPTKTP
jgi:hypothetical protein